MSGLYRSQAESGYTDCVYSDEKGGCGVLGQNRCGGRECKFRRSHDEQKNRDTEWKIRMRSLDEDQQRKISRKYYSGNMPWNRQ